MHPFAALLLLIFYFCFVAFVADATKQNQHYFWNTVTGEVTWEDPGNVPYVWKETGDVFYVNKEGKPQWERPEPSVWEEIESEEHDNLIYFHNTETGETTWDRPAELAWKRVDYTNDEL